MKEIKFRAWDKKDKVLREVYGLSFKRISNKGNRNEDLIEMHCSDYEGSRAIILSHFERPLKEVELMQFTGLKDKNGKEIYEGDLFGTFGGDKERPSEYEVHGQVKYDNDFAMFIIELTNGGWITMFDYFHSKTSQKEIIGNVYSNAELLTYK